MADLDLMPKTLRHGIEHLSELMYSKKVKFRIVYLDDEVDLLELYRETYESTAIEILTFSDPQLALRAIQQNPPDLVVLDYRLPGITGDELALLMDKATPKVLITGDLAVCPKAHFQKIFKKPYRVAEMLELISQIRLKIAS